MSEAGATPVAEQTAQPGLMSRGLNVLRSHSRELVAAGAILPAAIGMTACGGDKTKEAKAPQGTTIDVNCDHLTLTNSAFDYETGKFLPPAKDGIGNDNEDAAYTQSLFSAKGPLAGKADRASLAAVDAAITHPALEQNTNVTYDIVHQFIQTMNKLDNPSTGDAEAKRLCEVERVVLGSTVKFEADAITQGEEFITLASINGKSDLKGIRPEQHTAQNTIAGATFKVRAEGQTVTLAGKKVTLNGFHKVVFEEDGDIDITGVEKAKGGNKHALQNHPSGRKPSHENAPAGHNPDHQEKAPAGSQQQQHQQQGSGQTTHPNHKGKTGGGTTQPGKSPEKNQGPNNGPTTGPVKGPNHGATTGPENTPSGGGGGGTPPEQPEQPTPTTTPEQPTPTTTPEQPKPTPTPTSTPGNKGSEPGDCVPSEYTPCP